jgi:hypothetical protein
MLGAGMLQGSSMNPFAQGPAMPGMEFFQNLLKGSGMPSSVASWMAPTMDADELERKITELKAVLQWLEANARLTQATIQGLEVQRMTLSALKTMNVDLGGLAERMSDAMQAGAQAMGAAVEPAASGAAAAAAPKPAEAAAKAAPAAAEAKEAAAPLSGLVDPMQWWNAVSQQFTQVATQALRDGAWPLPGAEPAADEAAAARAPAAPKAAAKAGAKVATKRSAGAAAAPPRRRR